MGRTTGISKAAAIPHRTFIAVVTEFQPERAEVKMVWAPLFYTMEFVLCLGGIALGETMVMASAGRFEVEAVTAAVAEHGVTVLAVAPPVLVALERAAAEGIVGGLELLQRIIVGAASLSREVAERFVRRFRHRWRRRRRRGIVLDGREDVVAVEKVGDGGGRGGAGSEVDGGEAAERDVEVEGADVVGGHVDGEEDGVGFS
ncbi:4-coumarate--CoA ligase-like 7 [Acorus gramineus]|uniref:4-coumarate--CoA ligase-like 7 n=1 Tax=Acorus gramineus TaxID=55184 RepID=A0AAV9ACI6_ACOGR|nr:4-coumarate--CoA ligase-like 7 [Acorus gramineus]